MSLNVREQCHHGIPVTLLWAVDNFKRWRPGAKGVAIPGSPETHIVLSKSDSAFGWGKAGDTVHFDHSMQLEYEACISETVIPALDNVRKLFFVGCAHQRCFLIDGTVPKLNVSVLGAIMKLMSIVV